MWPMSAESTSTNDARKRPLYRRATMQRQNGCGRNRRGFPACKQTCSARKAGLGDVANSRPSVRRITGKSVNVTGASVLMAQIHEGLLRRRDSCSPVLKAYISRLSPSLAAWIRALTPWERSFETKDGAVG